MRNANIESMVEDAVAHPISALKERSKASERGRVAWGGTRAAGTQEKHNQNYYKEMKRGPNRSPVDTFDVETPNLRLRRNEGSEKRAGRGRKP